MKKISVYGIILLISISPLFRGLLFKYETYAFLAAVSLLSFIYLTGKAGKNEPIHINKIFTALGIAFAAACALSFRSAVNPRENLGTLLMYIAFGIIFMVLYDYFYNSKEQFIKAMMLTTVMTGFICAVAGMEALTGAFAFLDSTIFSGRLGSAFQYTNTAAIYFAICFLFSLTLAAAMKSNLARGLAAGAGNLFIFALFLTGSRGGYITAMAAILLFLAMQPSGCRLKGITNTASMLLPLILTLGRFSGSAASKDYAASTIWLAISFFLAVILYYLFYLAGKLIGRFVFNGKAIEASKNSGYIFAAVFAVTIISAFIFRSRLFSLLPEILSSRLKHMNLNDPNILYRLEFDKDAIKLITENWLTGLGGGGWLARYQSVQDVFYTANFTHNNYLQIFTETGILGFLSYIAMMLATLLYAAISYFKTKKKMLKVYIAGLFCGFTALAFHSSFDFDLTYISLSLLLWMMFAASAVNTPEEKTGRWTASSDSRIFKIIPAFICAILISAYALFFTGACNGNAALKYSKSGDYPTAMLYYEEANRLDASNSDYLFELSKIYCYFANKAQNNGEKEQWLKKALLAGEKGINLNRYYPPQLKTLIQIGRDMGMPEKYLQYSKELTLSQRCNIANYELLAECYLDAARYYKEANDIEKERMLLKECIAIQDDRFFKRAKEGKGFDMLQMRLNKKFKPSERLNVYFKEAADMLKNFE